MQPLSLSLVGRLTAALSVPLLASALALPTPAQGSLKGGAVFTASNAADGNAVLVWKRDAGGGLAYHHAYATGGDGSGSGLGNQGGVVLDRSGNHLLVVNAGSDTVSALRIGAQDLELTHVASSGGTQPISVTVHGDLVYVLNAGDDGNIAGLRLHPDGVLSPIRGSERPLSDSGTGPAQIAFTPDGGQLVVTEKGTNSIVTYAVGAHGLAGDPVVTPAAGVTPFGFSFGPQGALLVSEATGGAMGASTVSSYELLADGHVAPITSALATMQSAACWLVTTGNGKRAYVTNTASNSVTGLQVGQDGSLALLSAGGDDAPTDAGPIDAAVSRGGRFLYVLSGGGGTIRGYAVDPDGSLTSLGAGGTVRAGTNGLAAL